MIFSTWAGQSQRAERSSIGWTIRDNCSTWLPIRDRQAPINEREPAIASRLQAAVAAWREEVFAGPSAEAAQPRAGRNKAASGNAVDPRPIPVGYREFPITMLPARDGEPRGGVHRSSSPRIARTS